MHDQEPNPLFEAGCHYIPGRPAGEAPPAVANDDGTEPSLHSCVPSATPARTETRTR
jgi:hypothetical protein